MLLALLAACGGPPDADFDGFPAGDDCDDADPFVYPGAPDTAGDGLDTDCDGVDPALPYLGTWSFTEFTASYSGIELLVPGTASGTLVLGEDRGVAVDSFVTLDPLITGAAVEVEFILDGRLSPAGADDLLSFYAEGQNFDEQMHMAWDCGLESDTELYCWGEFKALDLSLDADAWLVR